MTTTTLSIDKTIRDHAAKRARIDQISLSAVARMLLRDYADGKINIGATVANAEIFKAETVEVDTETQAMMDEISILWKNRKIV